LGYWQIGNQKHVEYKSFNNHPIIGEIECSEPFDHLMVSVAHEVAHYVQYMYAPKVRRFKDNYRKAHGKAFKDIYGYLRRDLVNPIINAKVEKKRYGN
jgi:hypothetical protein